MKRPRIAAMMAGKEREVATAIRGRLRKALLTGELSLAEITARFKVRAKEARAFLDGFRDAGANLVERAGKWTIDRYMAPSREDAWKVRGKRGEPYRFGLVADTHIGSKHCRMDVLEGLYDWFAREGIRTVFHCGNW